MDLMTARLTRKPRFAVLRHVTPDAADVHVNGPFDHVLPYVRTGASGHHEVSLRQLNISAFPVLRRVAWGDQSNSQSAGLAGGFPV